MFTKDSESISKPFLVDGAAANYVGYIAGWYTFRGLDGHLVNVPRGTEDDRVDAID